MQRITILVVLLISLTAACQPASPESKPPTPNPIPDQIQATETLEVSPEMVEEIELQNIEGDWLKPSAYVDEHLILDADGTWLVVTPYTDYPVTDKEIEAARIFGTFTFEGNKLILTVDEAAEFCSGTVGTYKVTMVEEGKINLNSNTDDCKLRLEIIAGDWTLKVSDE